MPNIPKHTADMIPGIYGLHPLNKKEEEIELITKVITHPAAFNVDLFGDLLTIRSHDSGYKVAWIDRSDGVEHKFHHNFLPEEVREAVTLFIEKRYEFGLGMDFEAERVW